MDLSSEFASAAGALPCMPETGGALVVVALVVEHTGERWVPLEPKEL